MLRSCDISTVCITRILAFAVLASLCVSFADAATIVNTPVDKLQYFIEAGKLHHSIKARIDQAGESEVLVVLDGTEANAMAEDTKKLLGVKQDSDDIVREKARLHKKKKEVLLSSIREGDYQVLKSYEHFPLMHLKIKREALEKLLDIPGVALVSDNAVFSRKLTESLPFIGSTKINDSGVTGSGTAVAVLDTGVNYTLPAFGSCTAPGIPAGCKVAYFQDFTQRGGLDASGHGTNVAGIIVGVAPDTKIVALNVFRADGYAYETDVIEALDWVLANRTAYNISVVNLSLGTGRYAASCSNLAVAKVIDDLKRAGIVTIVPSGNDAFFNALSYPACSPAGVSVGAVYDSNMDSTLYWQEANCTDSFPMGNQVACFSNSSPFLTMLAPGAIIAAAGTSMSGTSQAAGHVSGAVALLKGKDPLLTADEIIAGFSSYGVQITDTKNGITKPMLILSALVNNTKAGASTGAGQSASGGTPTASDATTNGNSGGTSIDSSADKSRTQGTEGIPQAANGQNANHQIAGPGWFMGSAPAVSHETAKAFFDSVTKKSANSGVKSGTVRFSAMSATDATPEITELARGLRNDPKLIYDYVHNNIDYVPYYGSLKGATLTYLDGSGNDFDQASLMIALLKASGYTAQYVYGKMTIPGTNVANWIGVDVQSQAVGNLIASGGIPVSVSGDASVLMDRVWVKATIGGANYLFDPAFKAYTDYNSSKMDLPTAMGYNRFDFLTGATTGATVGADYVQNLNESNIKSRLTTYASNLAANIRSQKANKSVEEIVGGRSIVQSYLTQYVTSLPFSPAVSYTWDAIPAAQTTTLRIQHVGIDYTANTHDLSGKRLTVTYAGADYHPELRLDGTLLVSGTATALASKNNCTITINHPYAANSGAYQDQTVVYTPESGRNYAIVYNFGGVSDMLLQKRQQKLDSYKAQGLADTTESVLGETLHIMGMTWLKETSQSMQLLSAITDTVPIMHHNVGFMSQEAGYYIDVKAGASSIHSRHNTDADKIASFKVYPLIGSAFEHGILEQLMGSDKPGVSTMKLFQIANATGRKVFLTGSSNFATVKPQLINYTATELTDFQNQINSGKVLVIPDNGQLALNQWKGKGYISKYFSGSSASMGMIIGGNYFGGFAATQGPVSTSTVMQNNAPTIISSATPDTIRLQLSAPMPPASVEPVDMASGAYFYDHTDLALGGSAPLGLAFTRSYDSSLNLTKRALGYGWTHSYDGSVTSHSHGDPVLGRRQPIDAASFIAALYTSFDLLKYNDDMTSWMTASLASKWAVDQAIDNAVSVRFGKKVMEFVRFADGSFVPPPGETTNLIKNSDGTYSLHERHGNRTDFDSSKRITKITDTDGNYLTIAYTGDRLSTVTDAFNRTLTLGYDPGSGLINSVTDSTGRIVRYGFTGSELTSYTDPEQKEWGYGYGADNSHRMTTLTKPASPLPIITATNVYDTFGRVKSQTVPRQKQQDNSTTATYNFYFSGYRNAEQDPAGNNTVYYFDSKGRTIGEENALGNRVVKQYDGQNHAKLVTDPRQYKTGYLYDSNLNLSKITNAVGVLNYDTTYQYDDKLRLSDIFDPLLHNTHFEYDAKHHLTLTKDNLSNTTQATYNGPKGAKDTATDGRATVTSFTYDGYGNPETKKIAGHPVLTYVYDPIGRMTDLTDQVGSKTSFVYDKRNLLKTITDPGRFYTTGFTYYDDGNLWTKTDRNGNTVTFTYTKSGKPESKSYPSGTPLSFTYNILDQLTVMQDSIGTTTYGYDPAGRINSVTDPHLFNVSYKYDEAGNLQELTYPGNKKVIYTYDELNRLKTVKIDWLSAKPVATYIYKDKEIGLLDNLTHFNSIKTTYSFDTADRLTGISIPSVASYSFTELDGNGNRKSGTQTEPLAPAITPGVTVYSYNTTKNRLLTAGTNSFDYDRENALKSGYGGSYVFDYEHRLTNTSGASFYYDGAGNRLIATRNGVTTKYIYDATGNLLAEADSNNVITRYYVYGAGLLAMVTPQDQVYNYHYNTTGSTVAITDQNQTMVNKYAYDPFGNSVNQQETITQPFKYVGQYGVMSEPNGFYYMKARYYDPQVGRFISEDPLGFDGGDVNLMAYVGSNPVNRVDPSGLFWFRQDWQTDFVVGRDRTPVPPGGAISRFIEDRVPAGRTFGDLHDGFVDAATSVGIPDAVVNIPSMIPMYAVAIGTEALRTLGIFNQPTPVAQPTTTRQPAPCK